MFPNVEPKTHLLKVMSCRVHHRNGKEILLFLLAAFYIFTNYFVDCIPPSRTPKLFEEPQFFQCKGSGEEKTEKPSLLEAH